MSNFKQKYKEPNAFKRMHIEVVLVLCWSLFKEDKKEGVRGTIKKRRHST
jgi:hypothetical protein